MEKSRIDELIKKHLKWHPTDLRHASVKYWAESGNISGSIYTALHEMVRCALDEASHDASALPIHSVSKSVVNEDFLDWHCPKCGKKSCNTHCD